MKYTGPKAKRARRHGMNLYGSDKYDKILQKKPYGPGKGPKDNTRIRLSEYGTQLKEKQKARDVYGLSERQFHRYYALASKVSGQTGDFLKQLLERRLDNVIYRAGFAQTRMQARQLVSHGHFLVNGRRVTVPSFQVRPGEAVVARPASKTSPVFIPILQSHEKYLPPNWLRVDSVAMKIEIAGLPQPEHAEQAIDMRQIVEFYSRN
ncbi:MAG: 30S ribosomal protein S4 [Candidatus Peribacteraceae bacterium]|jgi:small subunit ribosomal protein S4